MKKKKFGDGMKDPFRAALLNVGQASRLIDCKRDACTTFVTPVNAPGHPIRAQLLRLAAEFDSAHAPLSLFAVIRQEGTV